MGTSNYNLPKILGTASVKIPRDFNALADAIDTTLSTQFGSVFNQLLEKAQKTEINTLASAKADKSYVDANLSSLDAKINSQASGAPKGTYATTAALTTAFPTGNSNVYVVTADGKWYFWNGTSWVAGGTYQATSVADDSITSSKLKANYNFVQQSATLDLATITKAGTYICTNGCLNMPPSTTNYFIVKVDIAAGFRTITAYKSVVKEVYVSYGATNESTLTWVKVYPVVDNAIVSQYKALPSGVTNIADITETGFYFLPNGKGTFPELGDLGLEYQNSFLNVFSHSGGGRIYSLQVNYNTNLEKDNFSFVGYKYWNESKVRWKRILTNRDQPFYGKKLCLLGDSIMASLSNALIASRTGFTVENKAKGGSTVALRTNTSMTAEWDPWALCTISKTGNTNSVSIENYTHAMIFIGTNDWGQGHPLGTIDGTDELTILGAYNVAIQNLLTRNPSIRLAIATPLPRYDATGARGGSTLAEISDAIKSLGAKYNIPVINMHVSGGVNSLNKGTLLNSDNLHLSPAGIDMVSGKFAAFVDAQY